MAKAKKPARQKLKIYRTPIGFHDAYVAAPSQKAALEAWGIDVNLFARGSAEEVTNAELMGEPLSAPGVVFKRLRGTEEEQIAALGKTSSRKLRQEGSKRRAAKAKAAEQPKRKPRPPKPRWSEVGEFEDALEALHKEHRHQEREMKKREQKLATERRSMEREQVREEQKLGKQLDRARRDYEQAKEAWEAWRAT